nr:MAG TPA_asm: hypothetical protein [Caudoviricetes sp.]
MQLRKSLYLFLSINLMRSIKAYIKPYHYSKA